MEKDKLTHCTGCTDPDPFDLPEGRTHQMDTIEHPLITTMNEQWEKEFEEITTADAMPDGVKAELKDFICQNFVSKERITKLAEEMTRKWTQPMLDTVTDKKTAEVVGMLGKAICDNFTQELLK